MVFTSILSKRIQKQDATAREQCAGNFERGVLGSGSNQSHGAVFNRMQECVLLAFIEAMDLVNKKNRASCQIFVRVALRRLRRASL